jgi:hypothetical protein
VPPLGAVVGESESEVTGVGDVLALVVGDAVAVAVGGADVVCLTVLLVLADAEGDGLVGDDAWVVGFGDAPRFVSVGLGDDVFEAEVFAEDSRLVPVRLPPPAVDGSDAVAGETTWPPGAEPFPRGVLVPDKSAAVGPVLLDRSSATMAMIPHATAPIPARSRILGRRRSSGNRSG